TIQLQNPRTRPDRFDMIVAPRHDDLTGANVIVTQGAIHRVTARRLAAAAQQFAPRLDRLPRPRVAVLIGGSNGVYQMTPAVVAAMADR
ncbi:ELM1/GtrOC1 family putative glycosyltransferase, partial [Acinetobacter baumannii]